MSAEKPDTEQQEEQQRQPADGAADDKPKPPWKKGPPGGYDATPIPHAPPGYTVRITFHRATALPLADLATLSSDPYIRAELKTSLPQRHKEDPVLAFRSHTVWRSTAPEWNEQWILHHVPASGFKMKVRIYDEDSSDTDDRLGNVHLHVGRIDDNWEGIHDQPYKIKKRSGSKRAYLLRSLAVCFGRAKHMSGELHLSVDLLGKSPGDEGGRTYTVGKNYWCKHYSPLLGRIVGSKEPDHDDYRDSMNQQSSERTGGNNSRSNRPKLQDPMDSSERKRMASAKKDHADADELHNPSENSHGVNHALDKAVAKEQRKRERKTKQNSSRYNFQANQMQLTGPVPAALYHRYVEFRPFMKSMFTGAGVRGMILSKALHHQHNQVYNFNRDTRYGVYDEPCKEMALKFLELCHFDEGARIFTYVVTLDALLRFTETGKEFGIDLLSKHTMHSDRSIYIAISGEFFIRRLKHPYDPEKAGDVTRPAPEDQTHPPAELPDGSPHGDSPKDPAHYELVIDNDSGTYRPNAKLLPVFRRFLQKQFPGLKVVTLDCQKDEELMNKLKSQQRERKKAEQGNQSVVYTQVSSSSSSSVSSDDEDRLDQLARDRDVEAGIDNGQSSGPTYKHRMGGVVAPLVGNHPHVREGLGERA